MREKGLATAVATLLAAFATAHLMQFGLSAGRAFSGGDEPVPIGFATFMAARLDAAPAEMPEQPATLPQALGMAVGLAAIEARELPSDAGVPPALAAGSMNGFGLPCGRSLALVPEAGSMLTAIVDAPCDIGVRVEIRHAGLRFALETDGDGRTEVVLPALTSAASVEAVFADGTVVRARTAVPDADRVERIAVIAEGWAGMSLHAIEFGARYGGALDVHDGAAGPREGALYHLGAPGIDAPLLAEVYTFPSRRFAPLGDVALRVEAEVTAGNCARDVTAEVVRTQAGGLPDLSGLRLAMPACAAEGDMLVVDLPRTDLRVARN